VGGPSDGQVLMELKVPLVVRIDLVGPRRALRLCPELVEHLVEKPELVGGFQPLPYLDLPIGLKVRAKPVTDERRRPALGRAQQVVNELQCVAFGQTVDLPHVDRRRRFLWSASHGLWTSTGRDQRAEG
jgi:hypothetical protein